MKIVVGIDASTNKTGICVFEDNKYVTHTLIDCHKEKDTMKRIPMMANKICEYLDSLQGQAYLYYHSLSASNEIYQKYLRTLDSMVNTLDRTDYRTYSEKEKIILENTVLLVTLLYEMCKVKLVLQSEDDGINLINYEDTFDMMAKSASVQEKIGE